MKTIYAVVLAVLAVMALPAINQSMAQTTVTTTTTHHFHGFLWRHGLNSPFGFGRGNNVVIIPAQTLSNSVINNCPISAPVQLSTGQCITQEQAVYLEQTGQLQVGGSVTGLGQSVVGTPVVLGVHNWDSAFGFFHHFHHIH